MPITKNVIIRYQCLDRCFQNPGRKYYLEDLLEECNKSLLDWDPTSSGIARRQLYDDIRFMESSQGWNIPLERITDGRKKYFRYEDPAFSINNQPINELEAEQLKSAMFVLQRFKGMPQFQWINELLPKIDQAFNFTKDTSGIINFDNNEYLKGIEFIDELFNSILYKKTLNINYQSFKNPEPVEITFSPYHLKQYNNRWFVFGKNSEYENIVNLALDRIISIRESNHKYESGDIDFEEYFEDIIGVTKPTNQSLTKIIFQASPELAPYLITKPLHGSQKRISNTKNGFQFSIEVVPNIELEKLILSHSEQLEVIEPEWFRNNLKHKLEKTLKKLTVQVQRTIVE